MTGQLIHEEQFSGTGKNYSIEINLQGNAAGVYILQFISDKSISQQKISIQ